MQGASTLKQYKHMKAEVTSVSSLALQKDYKERNQTSLWGQTWLITLMAFLEVSFRLCHDFLNNSGTFELNKYKQCKNTLIAVKNSC